MELRMMLWTWRRILRVMRVIMIPMIWMRPRWVKVNEIWEILRRNGNMSRIERARRIWLLYEHVRACLPSPRHGAWRLPPILSRLEMPGAHKHCCCTTGPEALTTHRREAVLNTLPRKLPLIGAETSIQRRPWGTTASGESLGVDSAVDSNLAISRVRQSNDEKIRLNQ